MKEIDYIVVGLGIAGITFCEELEKNNKTFIVYDTGDVASTKVSAGVINPVVLKRFTPVWNAKEHIKTSIKFYKKLAIKLGIPLFEKMSMLKIFKSIEEQNNWMVASDKKELETFLKPKIIKNKNLNINAPFGFGEVNNTGKINPIVLIENYKNYLLKNNQLKNEAFDYNTLQVSVDKVFYKDVISKKIVFCEGASAKDNPYFPSKTKISNEPLVIPNKGEYIIINSPELKLYSMLKTSLFIIPLTNDLYKVGATYDREDHTVKTTQNAKEEMINKLKAIINCNFEVVGQVAGIRPTTRDRRPFLGTLLDCENKVFFNGLGTRGITSAPSLAKTLYNYIENDLELPKEMNIKRYYKW
jgi:glycine oxidase